MANPTTGLGVATAVVLTGTGVVPLVPAKVIGSNVSQFAVTVPIGGSVAVTALPVDVQGNPVAPIPNPDVVTSTPSTGGLGNAAKFAVLGHSGVTGSAGAGSIVSGGDLGSDPTASITNFPPSSVVLPGVIHAVADAATTAAQTDLAAAIVTYSALSFTTLSSDDMSVNGNGANLSTYTPGNYAGGALDIPTSITLDAQGDNNAVFVFKASSTVVLESGASILLINGALPQNVYWVVGSSFTSIWNGIQSNMVGNILAHTSITLGGGNLNGRALANTGAVTMATTEIINAPAFLPTISTVAGAPNPFPCNAIVNAGAPLSVPSWYKPSNLGSQYPSTYITPATLDDDDSNPWTVRGRTAGQVVIDFQIPTFENNEGQSLIDVNRVMDETYIDTIFAQLIVTVTGGTS